MSRYLIMSLLLSAILSLVSPSANAQSVPNAEQLDASLRSCAGQKKIDVDADVAGAIKEAWEGNVLKGKAKVDQFGYIIQSFKDENLRFKAYELYLKCLKDYLDTFSRGQHSQTSKQQKTAYDFNGCWQTDDTQDKRFIEAKSDRIFKTWSYNRDGKPYACLGEEIEVQVDASNHVVAKRLECPESDDRTTEAYFEKDDVLRIVRTIRSNGTQKPQGQRFIRLSRPEECPQPPPNVQKLPPKASLKTKDTERFRTLFAKLATQTENGAKNWADASMSKDWPVARDFIDGYNKWLQSAQSALKDKDYPYIAALQKLTFSNSPKQASEEVFTAAKGVEVYLTYFVPSQAFKVSAAILATRAENGTKYWPETRAWVTEYNRLRQEAKLVFPNCSRIDALPELKFSGSEKQAGQIAMAAKDFELLMSEDQSKESFCAP
jgi:hypothetical protein